MPIDLAADTGYALRLLVAAIPGALIGLEREIQEHPAGMRTHLLVSLGSAGFTVLSIASFTATGADPARIAAQVVSGIGFLGAGAILKEGATVRGLTTAASLWSGGGRRDGRRGRSVGRCHHRDGDRHHLAVAAPRRDGGSQRSRPPSCPDAAMGHRSRCDRPGSST